MSRQKTENLITKGKGTMRRMLYVAAAMVIALNNMVGAFAMDEGAVNDEAPNDEAWYAYACWINKTFFGKKGPALIN